MGVPLKTPSGLAFDIQYHSTEDGPGIRTSLFMKGCAMHCPWCHNPEGLLSKQELGWHDTRCIGAAECVPVCPQQALELTPQGLLVNRSLCDQCGECVSACPSGALEIVGQVYSVDDLVERLLDDRVFFERSGGGVTISGGEAAMQTPFLTELMGRLREAGVHIALDTCGGTKWKSLAPLVELADLVLYDIKIFNEAAHKAATGVPLPLVLDNAKRISETGKPMWIRTPIIPGYSDSDANVANIARFIKENLPTVERYDLLAFNHSCEPKYARLGQHWTLSGEHLLPQSLMEHLEEVALREGLDCVRWSGLTDIDDADSVDRSDAARISTPQTA